jgi:transposase-like protein
LFNRRHFADDVIILCVRWYLRFKLSYKDMTEIAWELGVMVSPSTILRWVVRYAAEFEKRWRRLELRVGGSWRADETYVKVNGGWMFLYRWSTNTKYLNSIVEQDHRRIKFRVQPMLGFKKFYNARRVLIGIELLQRKCKGQYRSRRS